MCSVISYFVGLPGTGWQPRYVTMLLFPSPLLKINIHLTCSEYPLTVKFTNGRDLSLDAYTVYQRSYWEAVLDVLVFWHRYTVLNTM